MRISRTTWPKGRLSGNGLGMSSMEINEQPAVRPTKMTIVASCFVSLRISQFSLRFQRFRGELDSE